MEMPEHIKFKRKSQVLEVGFHGQQFEFSAEFLRVFSPSAEVRGHGGGGDAVLQTGKKDVRITAMEPVGNYALKLVFDDGHDSGLYDWAYFLNLGTKKEQLWLGYLAKLEEAGAHRETLFINARQL